MPVKPYVCSLLCTRVLIHGCGADRNSSSFGVWAAPATKQTFQHVERRRPPHFGKVFGAAGDAQAPKTYDADRHKNHVLKKHCLELQRSSSQFLWRLMRGPRCTLAFLTHGVGTDRSSLSFGAWAAPPAQTNITKCGVLRPAPPPTTTL